MRTFDKLGIACVQICSIIKISKTNQVNRIVRANRIPHPIGHPELPQKDDNEKRMEMLMKAINALQTEITEQTLFE